MDTFVPILGGVLFAIILIALGFLYEPVIRERLSHRRHKRRHRD